MPPRKPPKTVVAEEAMAETIARLRERRGWSPAGLASRMTKAGCPMTQSAIWKIENGEPRRRITLDEAVTFAKVFEVELGDFLVPPDLVKADAAAATIGRMKSLLKEIESSAEEFWEAWIQLAAQWKDGRDNPIVWASIKAAVGDVEVAGGWADPWTPGGALSPAERIERLLGQKLDVDDNDVGAWLNDMAHRSNVVSAFLAAMEKNSAAAEGLVAALQATAKGD